MIDVVFLKCFDAQNSMNRITHSMCIADSEIITSEYRFFFDDRISYKETG
jgi:hypothetical protein